MITKETIFLLKMLENVIQFYNLHTNLHLFPRNIDKYVE